MNLNASANDHDDAGNAPAEGAAVDVRHLTPLQFAQLGMSQIAYVKPVVVNGAAGFAIHAADGTPMALAPAFETAVGAIRQHDMFPVLVH
ncbi:MAG: DUF1150 family protein [Proteobacteria bacterium]|nr:DUF1150 family protein [Pseudomonadota bacterium]